MLGKHHNVACAIICTNDECKCICHIKDTVEVLEKYNKGELCYWSAYMYIWGIDDEKIFELLDFYKPYSINIVNKNELIEE